MTADPITAARDALIDARLHLADVIRDACPKPHVYVQHRDRKPAWCKACGRDELGVRYARLAAQNDTEVS